jgi:hypothetical protein
MLDKSQISSEKHEHTSGWGSSGIMVHLELIMLFTMDDCGEYAEKAEAAIGSNKVVKNFICKRHFQSV